MALAACGGTSGKAAVAQNAAATPGDSHELRHVDLEFAIHDKPFPLPVVHGTVAGVPTLFLVDTGANAHILSGALARKAELTTKAFGDVGVDHSGRSIETRRAPHPQVHIDNWGDLPDEPMLVTDVPEAVTRLGIGGFLSPQQLVTDDASIVLDFQKSEMRQMHRGDTLDASGSALALDPPHMCLDRDSPLRGLAFVLHAQIDGHDANLLIDSGAHHSDLLSASSPAKALFPRSEPSGEPVYSASGKVTPRTVRHAHIRVGALEATRDIESDPGTAGRLLSARRGAGDGCAEEVRAGVRAAVGEWGLQQRRGAGDGAGAEEEVAPRATCSASAPRDACIAGAGLRASLPLLRRLRRRRRASDAHGTRELARERLSTAVAEVVQQHLHRPSHPRVERARRLPGRAESARRRGTERAAE